MLIRSLRRVPPSLLLLFAFLFFFGFQLSQGPSHEEPPPPPAPPAEPTKEEKKPPRIALMTFVTDQRSYLLLGLKSKDHYARRHGYDFHVEYETHNPRNIMFYKFDMAEKLTKTGKYDWLWWMDFDTLVTNTDIKVTDIIEDELNNATDPDNIDFLITHDCNGFNAGSFLMRAHDRSLKFFHDSVVVHDEQKKKDINLSEQECMVKLMEDDPATAARVKVMPQKKLNAFPEEIGCYDDNRKSWEHGDFLIHFAGAWAHVKGDDPTGQLMDKYQHEIIWGDWTKFPDRVS